MNRYARQTILKNFGAAGQDKLKNAKVLIIGAGGLGVPIMQYLNAMGVGVLGIVDGDKVSKSNLHRQVIYDEASVGLLKVDVAKQKLNAQNSDTEIRTFPYFLQKENALKLIADFDVIVDATDNFPTRYLVNDSCVILNKPFVYGALHAFEGQVSVFNYKGGPTYRCLFPTMPKADEIPNCDANGVLGILPGIIGNFQALEVIKICTGIGEPLSGKLLLYDALSAHIQKIKFNAVPSNLTKTTLLASYDFNCDASVKSILPSEFLVLENPKILDVRTISEFENYHLKNAKHIPLDELETRFTELKEPHYVICQSGIRSQKAIRFLENKLPNVDFINVTGGLIALQEHA